MATASLPVTAPGRRDLLRAGLAAGVAGLFGPALLAPGARAQAGFTGSVLTGSHWGAFNAVVENGRVTGYTPWARDPQPTHMLAGVVDSITSPSRIKYPMVRRAWLEKGPGAEPETRGRGDFVRVSWDQALDLVDRELKRVNAEHGPAGLFAGSIGWKSTGKLHNCRTLLYRMLTMRGQRFVKYSGDYSTGAAQVIMPHVVGTLEVYEQQTAWPVVVRDTGLLVFWGADPVITNQISFTVADHGAFPGMAAYKATGKPVICIDPVRTETAKYFGAEWIAPRPQTDVAMMLGIAHTLVAEGLHDQRFLRDCTTGFDRFLPYLMGQSDGTPKSAEWASAICGVPAETLKDLARRFARNRTMLAAGWSMQRQQHGEQRHWMLVTLAAMLGQIGLPGGGFGLSYHYSGGGAPTANGPALPGITDGSAGATLQPWPENGPAPVIPIARFTDMLENPGGEFDFNGRRQRYPDVKMVYWVGGNPFTHHQDRNRQVKAWRKVQTFVVHDFQWTATARHADIVLPATSAYERNDMETVGDYAGAYILAMKKAVEPVFEARNDYDIFAALAARAGREQAFTEGRSEMAWLRSLYEAARVQARSKRVEMPEFDAFWNGDGYVAFTPTPAAMEFVRHKAFRDDPLLNPLGTPSGRIEIFSRNIERMGYADCPPHPTWMEPSERLGMPNAPRPLHLASSHPRSRLHSQLNGTVLRAGYAVAGREPCLINPADAAARGIADGDVVRVFNARGQILAGAVVTDDIMPGVIRINEGAWYDPVESGAPDTLCRYGDVNVLTQDIGSSKLAQATSALTVLAEVEKYQGVPPAVQVFQAPALA